VQGRLTLLSEQLLHLAIPAETGFQFTGDSAAVEVTAVAIIALLACTNDAVSAEVEACNARDLPAADGVAAVSGKRVAVIALLAHGHHVIAAAATGTPAVSLQRAVRAAAVSGVPVVVITFLSELEAPVAAACREAVLETAVGRAAITVEGVAVIALLVPVHHLVPAARQETVLTAGIGGRVGVAAPEVALLMLASCAEVDDCIAALGSLAVGAAGPGGHVGVVRTIVTLLRRLDGTVSAGEGGGAAAGVLVADACTRTGDTLLTLFTGIQYTIPTGATYDTLAGIVAVLSAAAVIVELALLRRSEDPISTASL